MTVLEYIAITSPFLLFFLSWLIKMQMNLGKLRQQDLNIMNDYISIKLELKDYVKKSECELMHKNTADSLADFKKEIYRRIDNIDENQKEIQRDVKELLKR